MNIKLIGLSILFVGVYSSIAAQFIGFGIIPDNSEIKEWKTNNIEEYSGIYHFGDSESESTLRLVVAQSRVYAQIMSGDWGGGTEMKWIKQFQNLEEVSIEGFEFLSSQYKGEFVHIKIDGEKKFGLKITDPWQNNMAKKGEYEIGIRRTTIQNDYSGIYPEASFSVLSQNDLAGLEADELQIMRNEIFARYGYIFREGGKMEAYFTAQDWYSAMHENVNSFLTELEIQNIEFIRKKEASLK